MNMLSNLKTDSSIEEEKDSVGGGFRVLDSGLYDTEVELAYLGQSQGGAMSLTLHLKTTQGNSLRQTLWMTSGTAKGCKNYYEDKNGKKQYLPGFSLANALCLLTVGKEIGDLEPEDKVINLYNFEAQKELPTNVPMLTDLIGQTITAGIIKQVVDKNVKDAAGNYVPSGETREENEIDKFFRQRDGLTVAEIRAQVDEAAFKATWDTKWTGEVKNKAKGAATGTTPGAPSPAPAAGGAPQQPKSLFA